MGRGSLFESNIQRYTGPMRDTEPMYDFLNRAEGPAWDRVRSVLEDWYSDHPDPGGDLRSRFRKHDIRQHAPAWWELYVHALFRSLGFEVNIHPELPGHRGQPDYLATSEASRIYVECLALFENRPRPGNADAQAWITECLNEVRHQDFTVDVDIEVPGAARPKKREIVKEVEQWLVSLDYETVRALAPSDYPFRVFPFGDWSVKLTALPALPDRRGRAGRLIAVYPSSGVFMVTSVEDIRKLLKEKSKQGRGVDAPYIVAVLNWSAFAEIDDVEKALFGSTMFEWYEGQPDSIREYRDRNGFWDAGPPPRGGRVSGVLFSEYARQSRPISELPTLVINPWADQPVAPGLPFATHTARDTGEVYRASEATTSAAELFGLPPDWPGF